jgi:hypothetical protein
VQRSPYVRASGDVFPAARLGGAIALILSLGIFVSLLIRPSASLTLANVSILTLASIAGLLGVIWPTRFGAVLTALLLLLPAIYLLLWSGLGLLFLPSIILLIRGARQARSR